MSHLYCSAPVQSNIEDAVTKMAEKIIGNEIKVQSSDTGRKEHRQNQTSTTCVHFQPA